MEKVEVYFQVENGNIVGYHSDEIDSKNLPKGTKMVKADVENPELLLGLEEKFIKEENIERLEHEFDTVFIENQKIPEQQSIKKRLKSLLLDIQLAEELDENVSDLKKDFEKLKQEYKALKKDSITKVDAGRSRTITLPNNKTNLNGDVFPEKGEIKSITWSKIKGSGGKIKAPDRLSTTVTDLKRGYYEFKLSVTNDQDKIISDIVKVKVQRKNNEDDDD
ncbi:hypothetical protein J8281_14990 [Aquimarina sp. U1-2]|uniref:PKD domain-containing protein n=1 Tax=Aquimarina sp. U1-2 TaxID=2823141 RepID=UPI001AED0091|nr:hypothetical protein [Aquimarina sp. U1-2]MBP2833499.1 hypothetical protein [Aquimarina sp. U1-2]